MAKGFMVPVEVRINQRELEEAASRVAADLRDEFEALLNEQDDIPRATLADLLSMDQTEMTPTWQAIFTAVEDLGTVRRG